MGKIVYRDEDIKAQARVDAGNNSPATNETDLSPYEKEIISMFTREAQKELVSKGVIGELEKIDGQIKGKQKKLEDDFETRKAKIDANYQAASTRNSSCMLFENAKAHHARLATAFNNKFNKLNRMPYRDIPHWLYITIAVLIGIGEVPLNALVFRIFGEQEIMTWVMSLIIGLTLPWAAHFVGLKIREHGDGFSFPNALKAIVVATIIVGALYALTLMRQEYLELNKANLDLNANIVHASFLFFWLNLAIFVTATLVSYSAHDPIPGYQQMEQNLRKAEAAFAKASEAWSREGESITRAKNEEISKIEMEKNSQQGALKELMGKYDKILREGQEMVSYWKATCQNGIEMYRAENKAYRKDPAPQYFGTQADIPGALDDYAEKLDNNKD